MAPNGVQSSNITKLLLELGFGRSDCPTRPKKLLHDMLNKIDHRSLREGFPLPFSKSDSPQARALAQDFCEFNSRGINLWPENPNNLWPCWQTDRPTIIKALAHILSLKAFHKYQHDVQHAKAVRESQDYSDTEEESIDPFPEEHRPSATIQVPHREETLEARASRRFAPRMASTSVSPVEKTPEIAACIAEVKRAKPSKYNSTWITSEWLQDPNATFPEAAEQVIVRLMHETNFYDRNKDDGECLLFIQHLRGAKEFTHLQYRTMQARVVECIERLAADMWQNHLLVRDENHEPTKSSTFGQHWNRRESIWQQNSPAFKSRHKRALSNTSDAYDIPDETVSVNSRARATPLKDINITQASLRSKTQNDRESIPCDNTSPAAKRHRASTAASNKNKESIGYPTEREPNRQSSLAHNPHKTSYTKPAELSNEASRSNYPAEDTQRSPTPEASPSPVLSDHAERNSELSAAGMPDDLTRREPPTTATHDPGAQTKSPSIPASIPIQELLPNPPATIRSPQDASENALSSGKLLFFLPEKRGSEDCEVSFHASAILDLSMSELFTKVATGLELHQDKVDCLTLDILFGHTEIVLLRRYGAEKDWELLKDRIRRKFKMGKKRGISKFHVVIANGDTSNGYDSDNEGL